MNTDLSLNIKDINGLTLHIGDNVRIFKITDDSGSASDLYGVEYQVSGWVEIIYIESFDGIITYDEDLMMVVIKGNGRSIPLSGNIRYDIWNDMYERISNEDRRSNVIDYNLIDESYDTFIKYIEKLDGDEI